MAAKPKRHVVVVDGSNLATEGRTLPSLRQLDEAVRAYAEEDPAAEIVVVVDASFEHRIDPSERAALVDAELHGEVVSPPAGAIGRGDAFVLRIAERTGARVLSNDSFQEFHAEHPWLFDEGRLVGGKPVPGIGWIFTPRLPVRGPKSRQVTGKTRRGADALSPPVKAAELAKAAKKAAARKVPALPPGVTPKVGDVWTTLAAGNGHEPASNDTTDGQAVEGSSTSSDAAGARAKKTTKRGTAKQTGVTKAAGKKAAAKQAGATKAAGKKVQGKKAAATKAAGKRSAATKAAATKAAGKSAATATSTVTAPTEAPVTGAAGTDNVSEAVPARRVAKRGRRSATSADDLLPVTTAGGASEAAAGVPPGAVGRAVAEAAAVNGSRADAVAKKAAVPKAATQKAAAKKAVAQKAAAKKTSAKNAPTKNAPTKNAPAKKTPAEKASAKKAPAKEVAAKTASAEKAKQSQKRGAGARKVPSAVAGPPGVREAAPDGDGTRAMAGRTAREDPAVRVAIDEAMAEVLAPPKPVEEAKKGGPKKGKEAAAKEIAGKGKRRRRRPGGPPPAVNEPLAFITFVANYSLQSEIEGEVVSFTSHGAMVDVDLPGGGLLHCYIPLAAMGDPPPAKARQVLSRGERRRFVLVGLDPPRRVAELALPGVPLAAAASGGGRGTSASASA